MKRFSKLLMTGIFMVLTVFLFQSSVQAVPLFGDGGAGLQTVLNDITVPLGSGVSSVNVPTDYQEPDSIWQIGGSGQASTTLIIEVAAWANFNSFGVYDAANSASKVQVFAGANGPGTLANVVITDGNPAYDDGSVLINYVDSGVNFAGNALGFYLNSLGADPNWTGGVWHSADALNADGQDHMAAYQGTGDQIKLPGLPEGPWLSNEYILAFEDLDSMHWGNGNGINDGYPEWSDTEPDFTDFVVMVESVSPVGVPEPGTLLLLGSGLVGLVGYARLRLKRKRKH